MSNVTLKDEDIKASFERTDKLIAFKKELAHLINRRGIDNLLEMPDYILASVAVGQMEICSSIVSGITAGYYKAVLMT